MIIRFAEEKDIEQINKLLVQVNSIHHRGRPDLFKSGKKKYTDEELRKIMSDCDTPVLVAADDKDRVLGYAFCIFQQHRDSHILTDIKTLYIDDLCVDEGQRGNGVGKVIYDAVVRLAKEQGCYNVTLNVWCCNESAMTFYEKCGLKPQKVHGYNNKFDKDHHILISTLQTASRRNSLNPDVIIIDEIHFGYEKKMLNKIMEYNQKARIIGLSATPYDENGYPLKGFDVIINDYDLTYMIKNKYLVPLRSYILVKPDLSNVSIIAGDYELNQLSEAVSKNTVIMEIVTTSKPYIEKSLKTIVFAVDINHAELLKTAFQNEGFPTESLHSKSEEDDNEVIERFKKGYIKVLVSVLKLTTGFDVPETDLAIIARPTKSQNLYKQMVGRVLRIAPNKKNAILLDCGNVIENLGKPLEPIIPKDELEKKIQKLKCKHCESENIKLKKSSSNLYWECQDCGHKEDLENRNHYKCKN